LQAADRRTKLLFICSPGNPTARAIPLKEIERIAVSSQYEGLVVVDEAYVDFSESGSAISLINSYPNVVVLQTLSKAFGLAGIRCGFAIGAPDVIQLMNNVKAPYNINSMTTEVAINALNSVDTLRKNVSTLLSQRTVVMEKLKALSFVLEVFPSDSNFVLFRVSSNAKKLYTMVSLKFHLLKGAFLSHILFSLDG
jgi:histidinol-phosphate aminotransferase